jgi:nanoRNase/pAp phosphatase (c-di-AMP/oligoRNAs hydrolase)
LKREVRRLHRLAEALSRCRRLLILTHNNPDPDSIASAWILGRIARRIGLRRVVLAYGGIVGRTENRAMITVLRIPLLPLARVDPSAFDALALVDSQPHGGNVTLPNGRLPIVVFDHHPCRRLTRGVTYYDIREDYGTTTTILYEYLLAAGIKPDRRLSTAVFHAIRSETQNLGRDAAEADARVFLRCFPLVDNAALSRIEHAPLPRSYFAMIDRAIDGTRIYGEVAVTLLGSVQTPDMVAQFADLIVRLEGIGWALAIGRYGADLVLSIRTNHPNANAGNVIRKIVGTEGAAGGHDMIAGGRIPDSAGTPTRARRVEAALTARLLRLLDAEGVRPARLTRLQSGS